MRKYYKIRDGKGERLVPEGDFPISIGGGPTAGIEITGLDEKEEAAEVGLSEGQLYVQASELGIPVWYNRTRLKGSAWLKHGDTLQIGPCEIVFRVEEEGFLFQVLGPDAPLASIPPMSKTDPEPAIEIAPLPFRADRDKPTSSFPLKWLVWVVLAGLFCLLLVSAWFVFTARQVVVRIEPEPERMSISGGIVAPKLGAYYLLRTGQYTLNAFKECYQPFDQTIEVTKEKRQTINFSMEKLPGRLTINVHQEVQPSLIIEGARVDIDGEEVGLSPILGVEVKPGRRLVDVRAEKYQDFQTDVVIEGCEVAQSLDIALTPSWADVTIRSVPTGALVLVGGKEAGKTPLELELFPGAHDLKVSAERFKTWETRVEVVANQAQVLEPIRLLPADGTLVLRTNPPGATVMVSGEYAGKTPLEIPLRPDERHAVLISKPGYETLSRQVTLASDAVKKLTLNMVPKKGLIKFSVKPTDAELLINGKSIGTIPPELRLIALEQQIEIKKEGYQSFRTKITPRPGFLQEIKIVLKKLKPKISGPPPVIKTQDGYTLKLIRPGPFMLGASRREQGRRSNETLRKVVLKRPFYMGVTEVTNKTFRRFLAEHNSGAFKRQSLNRDDLPVVDVTWEQAALFCNWLSRQESLPPAYIKRGNNLVSADPLGTGYRLPTEAEWEYSARFDKGNTFLKYPWGNRFPPKPKSGNFADISARDLLANYLQDYDDGYPATSPPGKFTPNTLGLYDMGGNVAEWSHDYYSIYQYSSRKQYLDPLGPAQGNHHVVRGSSWKQASISALRLSYRDYSNKKRPDLGFRVCRYLNGDSSPYIKN